MHDDPELELERQTHPRFVVLHRQSDFIKKPSLLQHHRQEVLQLRHSLANVRFFFTSFCDSLQAIRLVLAIRPFLWKLKSFLQLFALQLVIEASPLIKQSFSGCLPFLQLVLTVLIQCIVRNCNRFCICQSWRYLRRHWLLEPLNGIGSQWIKLWNGIEEAFRSIQAYTYVYIGVI